MVTIKLKVIPASSRDCIVGWLGDALKIKVVAPPEKGKANQAVQKLLAKTLGIPKQAIQIEAGTTSAYKTVTLDEITESKLKQLLRGFCV